MIKKNNGITIKITRDKEIYEEKNEEKKHISENAIDHETMNYTIENFETLSVLNKKTKKFINNLLENILINFSDM